MMKKINFKQTLLFFLFSFNLLLKAQTIEYNDKYICLKINVIKQSDTCYLVERTLQNIFTENIYVQKYGDKFNYDDCFMGVESNHFIIKAGVFARGVYSEVAPRLVIIEPRNALTNTDTIFIQKQKKIEKFEVYFDYLVPSLFNKKEQNEIFSNLALYPEVNKNENEFTIFRYIYAKYEQTLNIKITGNVP